MLPPSSSSPHFEDSIDIETFHSGLSDLFIDILGHRSIIVGHIVDVIIKVEGLWTRVHGILLTLSIKYKDGRDVMGGYT